MKIGLIARVVMIAALAILLGPQGKARAEGQQAAPPAESALSIPQAQLMQPVELNRLLQERGARKPILFDVGFRMLFAQSHIPGSEYAGPTARPEGIRQLRQRVQPLKRNTFIVIYCGCCPWNHCPNMGPAFHLLQSMGFTHVKALYLPDNFGTDWVSKGYPAVSGQ
jgi:thiosulfate/3-mercaptopyruvate sulfurtransferase